MLPPISRPSDWEMIENGPPAPMRIFVVIDDMERLVNNVIDRASSVISKAPATPALPTTHGCRKYMITPRMVRVVGVKTP